MEDNFNYKSNDMTVQNIDHNSYEAQNEQKEPSPFFTFLKKHFSEEKLVYFILFISLPILFLLSVDSVFVKPIMPVGIATAVIVAIYILLHNKIPTPFWYILAGLLGCAACNLLFTNGFPRGHDSPPHMWGIYGFYRAISFGNYFPGWNHNLAFGMPLYMFYPPLSFYLSLPFYFFDLPIYDSFKYTMILMHVISGLLMYKASSAWFGDKRAALIASLAYCFAPYHLLDVNYRTAFAETGAMAILPVFYLYLIRSLETPSKQNLAKASIPAALLIITHPLSASMAFMGAFFWSLGRFAYSKQTFKDIGKKLSKSVISIFAIGIIASMLSGFYTVPVATEGSYTTVSRTLQGAKHPMYWFHGLSPMQIIERRMWSKWQTSKYWDDKEAQHRRDEMPFYIGISLILLLPLARRHTSKNLDSTDDGLNRGLIVMAISALILTLHPLDMLFAYFPPMKVLQFPWRFLSIATFALSALVGATVLSIITTFERKHALSNFLLIFISIILLVDFFPYTGASLWAKPYQTNQKISQEELSVAPKTGPIRIIGLDYPPTKIDTDISTLRGKYPEYQTKKIRKNFQSLKVELLEKETMEQGGVYIVRDKTMRKTLDPYPYSGFYSNDVNKYDRNISSKNTIESTRPVALSYSIKSGLITTELPGKSGTIVILEQWFPGWKAFIKKVINNAETEIELKESKLGFIEIPVGEIDKGTLILKFSRTTPNRLAGIIISIVTLLIVIYIALSATLSAKKEENITAQYYI